MKKIFIDAGHGGSDPGATGNGLKEKDLTLAIAKHTQVFLNDNYTGHAVKMSRVGDTTKPTLIGRTTNANNWNADILVSIHINAFNSKASGFETFAYPGASTKTTQLQTDIHNELKRVFNNFPDRGKKKQNLHMLRDSNMSACLTESLFIDNKRDADFLKQESNLKLIGKAHAIGIAKFLGLKEKVVYEDTDSLYKVQVGAFSKKENAEQLKAKLIEDGYKVYIVQE